MNVCLVQEWEAAHHSLCPWYTCSPGGEAQYRCSSETARTSTGPLHFTLQSGSYYWMFVFTRFSGTLSNKTWSVFSSSTKLKGGLESVLTSRLSKALWFKHTFSGIPTSIKKSSRKAATVKVTPWPGLFRLSTFSSLQGAGRLQSQARAAPLSFSREANRRPEKARGFRDAASYSFCPGSHPSSGLGSVTHCLHSLTCSNHSFMYSLTQSFSLSFSILFSLLSHSLPFLWPTLSPPLFRWRQARSDAQMCTGPSGTRTLLFLYGANSFIWSVTPFSHLQITPSFLSLVIGSQMPHFTVRKPEPRRGSATHLKPHSCLWHNPQPWIKLNTSRLSGILRLPTVRLLVNL